VTQITDSVPFPGDDVGGFELQRLVAYQGKPGCEDWRCTRRGSKQNEDGTWDMGECMGYHCPLCDQPANSYGHHDCPRAGDVAA
jgi:hypothetical protein